MEVTNQTQAILGYYAPFENNLSGHWKQRETTVILN